MYCDARSWQPTTRRTNTHLDIVRNIVGLNIKLCVRLKAEELMCTGISAVDSCSGFGMRKTMR